MKHHRYGSSTAARTDACPGWLTESEGIPRSESGFALDGTIIHTMLEQRALDDEYRFDQQLGQTIEGGVVHADLIERARYMWVLTQDLLQKYGAIEWEPEVTGIAAEDVGGTLDLIVDCGDRALLVDYKSGKGIIVDPVGNKQLLFAAWVCLKESSGKDLLEGKTKFTGVIIQSNDRGLDDVREWDFTLDQVVAFGEHHEKMIAVSRGGEGHLCPGDHCRFCPAASVCSAKTGDALRALQMDPEDLTTLTESMNMVEGLKQWCAQVEKTAYNQLEVGAEVKGWKLVTKRATERWKDAEVTLKALRRRFKGKRNIVEEKLLSPAQMRKLAKAQGIDLDLSELTEKTSSGTTLAPEDDKREAVLSAAAFGSALASVQ